MNKENIERLLEETNYKTLLELVHENGLDPDGDLVITEDGTRFWVILTNNQVNILH